MWKTKATKGRQTEGKREDGGGSLTQTQTQTEADSSHGYFCLG